MPLAIVAQNFSHGWTQAVTHAALFQSVEVDGTPTEVSGDYLDIDGFPIYTRRPIALTEAADGSVSTDFPVKFGVPSNTTLRWFGLVDFNGELLCLEPISTAVISNVPMLCLFRDGLVITPTAYSSYGAPYIVFWGGPSPTTSLLNAGAYSSLPPELYERPYWLWTVVGGLIPPNGFQIQADVEADILVPSSGWGWFQRAYPITYADTGTYTLAAVHVRTTG